MRWRCTRSTLQCRSTSACSSYSPPTRSSRCSTRTRRKEGIMAIHGTLKSVVRSTDGTAVTGKGFLYGITISGAAGEVIVYDNTAAAGTKLLQANGLGND